MRIQKIEVTDFQGIPSLTVKPGALTIIEGANGQGKTSFINAIRATFEGGHDPALIRQGAKKAEVVLTLVDGTVIKRTITAKDSKVEVLTKDGDKKAKPSTYVESLASGVALDPIGFLTLPPKKRGEFLLRTSNVEFTGEELTAAGVDPELLLADLNIEGFDKLRKEIYESRRAANVRYDESAKQVKGLKASMPEDMDADYVQKARDLQERHATAKSELAQLEEEAKAKWEEWERDKRSTYQEQIRALEAKRDKEIAEGREVFLEEKNKASLDALRKVEKLASDLRETNLKADEQRRAQALKGQLEAAEMRMNQHGEVAVKHDATLAELDKLKSKKLAEDGIEGVEIVDGDIHVDGIPFDKLNTQRQYEMAFMLASRGLGQLPIMICDRAESFDEENWKQFCEVAASSGIQVVAARVTDGPLKVEVAA